MRAFSLHSDVTRYTIFCKRQIHWCGAMLSSHASSREFRHVCIVPSLVASGISLLNGCTLLGACRSPANPCSGSGAEWSRTVVLSTYVFSYAGVMMMPYYRSAPSLIAEVDRNGLVTEDLRASRTHRASPAHRVLSIEQLRTSTGHHVCGQVDYS